jgi:hypothetical protein
VHGLTEQHGLSFAGRGLSSSDMVLSFFVHTVVHQEQPAIGLWEMAPLFAEFIIANRHAAMKTPSAKSHARQEPVHAKTS